MGGGRGGVGLNGNPTGFEGGEYPDSLHETTGEAWTTVGADDWRTLGSIFENEGGSLEVVHLSR